MDRPERRKQNRFTIRLPVRFQFRDEQGTIQEGEGYTRDLSLQGAYIYTGTVPPAASIVGLVIYFTSLLEIDRNVRWVAKARVLRVGPDDGESLSGFSSITESFALFNGETGGR